LILTSTGDRRMVRGTALARDSLQRLARNAAIALGNSHSPAAEAPLARAVIDHRSELVRAHAAWALGALGLPLEAGRRALERAVEQDACADVRLEAGAALAELTSRG
jgi:HEAT repeat protein